ncbi:hypothetical protein SAMN05444162_4882 [Paenibacillaceae bacterium GAS479]|nr:hypothetical protein SAMN05444162_4882 [Paenibacillaceae bacterium GAS479]
MDKAKEMMLFNQSFKYIDDGVEHGILSKFNPGTMELKKGYQVDQRFMPLLCDVIFERDVPVKLRDGVTIYTDVFRPSGEEKVPVIISWSPYGKAAGTAPRYTNLFGMIGIPDSELSGLHKFEGSDPAYWCNHGYAVCNPDPRGIAHSEGDIYMIGTQEARDCYDLIEWLAEQEWCNGKVATSGTSYLALSQWFIAAEQPPHLAAINPVEGFGDAYRDLIRRGGILDVNFASRLQVNHVHAGKPVRREDVHDEGLKYPFANCELWEDKIAKFENITCPAYVVASYSNTLHTPGTFRAWRSMPKENKWLRIHDNQEWPDFYKEEQQEDRLKFFDHFLKGIDNGWEKTPVVRYALHDFEGGHYEGIEAETFPPKGTEYKKMYLDGATRTLSTTLAKADIPAIYDSEASLAQASFLYKAEEKTELVGYPKAKLYVEVDGSDDMDILVYLYKLDKFGNHLQQFVVPNMTARMHDLTDRGGSVLRYKGSNGRLRVSMRHLDEEKSTDEVPAYTFDREEKLHKGEIVEIEIEMFPIGMLLYPGEQLRFIVSAKDEVGGIMPGTPAAPPVNFGKHIIHCGGQYDSYLQLPVRLQ